MIFIFNERGMFSLRYLHSDMYIFMYSYISLDIITECPLAFVK